MKGGSACGLDWAGLGNWKLIDIPWVSQSHTTHAHTEHHHTNGAFLVSIGFGTRCKPPGPATYSFLIYPTLAYSQAHF